MAIKSVPLDMQIDKVLAEMEADVPEIVESATADVEAEMGTVMNRRLIAALRKARNNLREIKRHMKSDDKNLSIDKVCDIIKDNLQNRSIREACNIASAMYGPAFLEVRSPVERVRICETILGFFDDSNTAPPLSYWRTVLESDGKFDY
ncbi:hypothetical protein GR7B_00079 [Vibrio phage vB_VcorM_GR7B]|nr:hypothetical protein GR7B_00079 [Vibrio phage vB_VcorM_GR7B]